VITREAGKKGKTAKKQKGDSGKSNLDGQQQQPKAKKSKAEKAATKAAKPSSVVYLGHLPHGFEEAEIRGFLNQFGSIRKLRLSRSKKTGNSRGYGFVQFVDPEVAAIVADTMSGYFLMEKRLVCHIMPRDKCHPELFAGNDRKFVKIDWQGLNREQVNKPRTAEGMKKITARLVKREAEKRKKLEALGIDYDFPGYAAGAEKGDVAGSTGGKRKRKASKDEGNEDCGDENATKTPKRRERKGSEVSTDGESSTRAKSVKNKSGKKKRKTSDAEELGAIGEEEEIKIKTPKKSISKQSAKTEVKKAKKSGKKKRRDSVP
jgi:nucleolar protein 15